MNKSTKPLDLGRLSAPVLVFGGPNSILAATQAMRQGAEELVIPSERITGTRDLVAACAEPRYFGSGSPFEYERVRRIYTQRREREIAH